jgi:hypothetical protein
MESKRLGESCRQTVGGLGLKRLWANRVKLRHRERELSGWNIKVDHPSRRRQRTSWYTTGSISLSSSCRLELCIEFARKSLRSPEASKHRRTVVKHVAGSTGG